jgi:putative ABC transport system permease protein
MLTGLGIVFGVASVVAMLAIGEGLSQEAQARIRRLGSRNLLMDSRSPPSSEDVSEERQRVLEYGLLYQDLERVRQTVPGVNRAVPRRDVPEEVRWGPRKVRAKVAGTEPAYADVANLDLEMGRFLNPTDGRELRSVCVLGSEVAERLFMGRDPIDRTVRAGSHPYRIVGVLQAQGDGGSGTGAEIDTAVFVPLETMQDKYGDVIRGRSTGSFSLERVELHRIIVETERLEDVTAVAAVLRSLVDRWHPKDDVGLTVPLELLREARRTRRMFTVVLATIAAISLVVGGIGIMNIMLASVLERTREVGIRRALGARRRHIILQFLAETVLLSVIGGGIGLLLGIFLPQLISYFWPVPTVVTPWSLGLAFGSSAAVGVIFGLYPAARAADLDPVEALRRE